MITAQMVYDALLEELGLPMGFISSVDGVSLTAVTVDGDVDCEAIAKFLNAAAGGATKGKDGGE